MATVLHPDFKDFLKLLNTYKVDYLLIGGYAVGFYGYPRATADMDIWIACEVKNAGKMLKVMKEFGFDVPDLSLDIFLEPKKIVRLGKAPIRIEIWMDISGVFFEECFKNKVTAYMDRIKVNIINRRDLIKNKRASAREKDLDDLKKLT